MSAMFGSVGEGFDLQRRHKIFGCSPHVAGTPVFYIPDILCKRQHVVLNSLHTLLFELLCSGILYENDSHHRSDISVLTYSFLPSDRNFGS